MIGRSLSMLAALVLSLAVALSGVLLARPGPVQAETPGTITVAAEPCDGATASGATRGEVRRVEPGAPCGTGQAASLSIHSRDASGSALASATAGVVYVVDINCCGGNKGGVIRVDLNKPVGSNQTVISSGQNFVQPFGIALAADGMLYVVDSFCCTSGLGAVIRVDPNQPDGQNQTIISSGQNFVDPVNAALAADGSLYVVDPSCCASGHGAVIRVDPHQPDGQNQTVISSGQNFVDPVNVALAADGSLYIVENLCCATGSNTGAVIKVDPSKPNGNNQTVISSGQIFVNIQDIVLAADGMLYIADIACCVSGASKGAVIRVDPSKPGNSNQTVISNGQSFSVPVGIGLSTSGTLLVADQNCCTGGNGALIEVDPNQPNGSNQFLMSGGQSFVDPADMVAVPQVAIADATVTEGTGSNVPASFAVTRAPFSVLPLSMAFTTANGSATGGADFTPTSGSVTFAAGQTSTSATIQVVGDSLIESTETFTVILQPPNGVATTRATATGTILNDDSTCSPRPRVVVTPAAGGGKLQVHVESTPLNTPAVNPLTQIRFGTFLNATVTLNGQPILSGQTFTVPANATTVDFSVTRATPGQATMVPFTVVDGCGEWPTFVGGGTGAGF